MPHTETDPNSTQLDCLVELNRLGGRALTFIGAFFSEANLNLN